MEGRIPVPLMLRMEEGICPVDGAEWMEECADGGMHPSILSWKSAQPRSLWW